MWEYLGKKGKYRGGYTIIGYGCRHVYKKDKK